MDLEALYRDLHAHPELSFAEHRTAGIVAERLSALGLDTHTGIGRTGVAGVLRNGDGPTVLLRADMDALPVEELTGLPWASTVTAEDGAGNTVPVMHACGHDIHITCLLGAVEQLAATRDGWAGTVVAVFQPAEEHGGGAEVMVQDGLYEKVPRPDIVLGQHVAPFPAGVVGAHPGAAMAAVDTMEITLHGRGGHGSRPETTIDPVVMAASAVMRLQTIVSREVAPQDTAVVTVGTLHAGTKNNIIASDATLGISVRSFDEGVRTRVLGAVERTLRAESAASGAPREPDLEWGERYPVTVNDPEATARVNAAFVGEFGVEAVCAPGAISGSEDVGNLATAAGVPLVYWLLGGGDPEKVLAAMAAGTVDTDIPSNHSPSFAPLAQPTISVGVRALVVAAREFLA
ncbi:penicillin binding protein transpeptidase domain-containing protein [Leifsonia xyli subsp. cynodontis DSM 46306]|uniref:Peptidase M20 dimerisation domain-containing protein n=1 Tax=Leifsonia xyli subsp. cynodontis DSM 46306 TaxID=1389489 RepID=U3P4N0_LEIXC|nr:amidohydrolase [Leifsonia xyli]AGW40374.1 penicillin binding protein transpeptidase domain-containing protein [Leifsonia xyli subsp. cynodontis DSM 46306]